MKHHDPSTDYGRYPTLAPLPEELLGRFARCEHCGSVDFRFRLPDWTAVCKKCGSEIAVSRTTTGPNIKAQHQLQIAFTTWSKDLVILRPDGTCRSFTMRSDPRYYNPALHENDEGIPLGYERIVSQWPDICALSAGDNHIVGLRSDGTVLTIGYNKRGQCETHDWFGVTAISARMNHTVGLFENGSVRFCGSNYKDMRDVRYWSDITAVASGFYHIVGLRSNGTVLAIGDNSHGQCDVKNWSNITAIAAGANHTVGLCTDGTVKAVGDNFCGICDLDDWSDITAIAASSHSTVGLCKDGTVRAKGYYGYSMCNVHDWTDVVKIWAADNFTAAMQRDGTILCTNPEILKKIEQALA